MSYRILHVEDNPIDRKIMSFAISRVLPDVEFDIAEDGGEAIALLDEVGVGKRPQPEVIVLDLNLPRYSGIEVLAYLRRKPELRAMKVAILTSSVSMEDRRQTQMLGIQGYFIKPMNLGEMDAIVQGILGIAASSRNL